MNFTNLQRPARRGALPGHRPRRRKVSGWGERRHGGAVQGDLTKPSAARYSRRDLLAVARPRVAAGKTDEFCI